MFSEHEWQLKDVVRDSYGRFRKGVHLIGALQNSADKYRKGYKEMGNFQGKNDLPSTPILCLW